ncbi:hypothetical protein PHYPSEUDO_003390 [Phytophthora pseudosyringae]|uniref:Uncharacterized protein n=1 Tax=Phytophthora pseudosyringae TaxID=221518 RepID=A0A8T1VRD8_9STRA|nr:hypothetical protein PHYPSEUDO_003390 [Phytophthora pseudosyringae]
MLTHLRLQTQGAQDLADDGHVPAAADVQDAGASSCCIGCFRLMPPPPESPPEGSDEGVGSGEPELLCASCVLRLAGKSSKSPAVQSGGGGYGVLSPLPKLSLLVKAEAKCQDQLQLLRGQQDILRQQRESLQATKRAKQEALAAEREVARQRRRHFLVIQERRKREEELKFQQFQGEEHTSRSEQEVGAGKPKKKKPKPPKADTPLQRRKSEPAAAGLDANLPQVSDCETPRSHTATSNDNASTSEAHTTSLYERRRQMMACYSQDLSPLIDGQRPRRLPFPKPVAAIVSSSMMKRRHTPDNNAQVTAVATRNKNGRKPGKSPAPKIMRLRPLDEQKRYIKARPQQQHASNQFEDFHARGNNEALGKRVVASPLSLQPPRRLVDFSAPLTAEIKPVSWAYELAKDVLPQDDEAGSSAFSAPLHPVAEEDDGGAQFTMFPLLHQLPSPTFSPSKPEPPAEVTMKVPRWEYSAERLSSLLEKYNVSVSGATTSTGAPQL